MAQNIITTVKFVDDLKGTEFAEGEGETLAYSFDGTNYEIDLNKVNAEAFRKAMSKYLAASRVVTRAANTHSGRNDVQEVRVWAQSNGFTVADRGRISSAVYAAYDKFHQDKEDES